MMSNLNAQLLQCIDAGMDSIGNASKRMVYWYLVQKRSISRERILDDPNAFVEALKSLFGQGAGILERTIVRQLRETFGIALEMDGLADVLVVIKEKRGGHNGEKVETRHSMSSEAGMMQKPKSGYGKRDDRRAVRT